MVKKRLNLHYWRGKGGGLIFLVVFLSGFDVRLIVEVTRCERAQKRAKKRSETKKIGEIPVK